MSNFSNVNRMRKGLGRAGPGASNAEVDRILERMEERKERTLMRIKLQKRRRETVTLPKFNLPELTDE